MGRHRFAIMTYQSVDVHLKFNFSTNDSTMSIAKPPESYVFVGIWN